MGSIEARLQRRPSRWSSPSSILLMPSIFALMLLLHGVNASYQHSLKKLPRHRQIGFQPLFASTRRKYRLNNIDNINLVLDSLRGGGDGDDLVEENPEYEPPQKNDDAADAAADGSDDSEEDEEMIENDNSSDDDDEELSDEEKDDENDNASDTEELAVASSKSNQKSKHKSSKSNKTKKNKRSSSINKRLYKLWKYNQFNIYIILAIIAFRKDIYHICIQYNIIPTQINPITGERQIMVRWSTDVLKLILVLEVVRRCFLPSKEVTTVDDDSDGSIQKRNQTQQDDDLEELSSTRRPSPAVPLLLLVMIFFLPTLLRRNLTSGYTTPLLLPILTSFILRAMRGRMMDSDIMKWILPALGDGDLATRMAYLPPLEQHYTFEQLNERYYRDWGAWRKAFPTNPALQPSHHHLGSKHNQTDTVGSGRSAGSGMLALINAITSLKSSPSQSKQQQRLEQGETKTIVSSLSTKYPHVYNNGTAIVLDMTKLDTQASSMETIRDQISFLIHLVQSEDEQFFQSKKGGEVVEEGANGIASSDSTMSNATDDATTTTTAAAQESEENDANSPVLEVIVLLESPGGSVSSYGLAASHLQRLRSTPGIKLTICVDSVAASGGYMMACMASPNQLYCAPFAMVGSIGVIGQSVNVQKALQNFGVRPYVFLGGKNKQPVGMLGDVTKEGMETMQLMIDRIHDSFREHVREAREESLVKALVAEGADKPPNNYFQLGSQAKLSHSQQSLDRVANGDVFLGVQALKLGLVDRLITSDEYIAERIQHGTRVLKLVIHHRHAGLSSLFMGPPHHSFSWNKWFVRAKGVMSTVVSSWSGIDGVNVSPTNVQLKMDAHL